MAVKLPDHARNGQSITKLFIPEIIEKKLGFEISHLDISQIEI
jgi:hypothetical protein